MNLAAKLTAAAATVVLVGLVVAVLFGQPRQQPAAAADCCPCADEAAYAAAVGAIIEQRSHDPDLGPEVVPYSVEDDIAWERRYAQQEFEECAQADQARRGEELEALAESIRHRQDEAEQ